MRNVSSVRAVVEIGRGTNVPASFGTAVGLGVTASNNLFGSAIVACGDRDGDGVAELLVGAYGYDNGGLSDSGGVLSVWLARNGTMVSFVLWRVGSSVVPAAFNSSVIPVGSYSGWSVGCGGDFDGDGMWDGLAGAPNLGTGYVYVVWVGGGGEMRSFVRVGGLNASVAPASGDWFGSGVWVGGRGMGTSWEVVVGGRSHAVGGVSRAGGVWVMSVDGVSGMVGTGGVQVWELGRGAFASFTTTAYENFGQALGGVGDIDCDGGDDVVVGTAVGRLPYCFYVVLRGVGGGIVGVSKVVAPAVTPAASAVFGYAVAGVGDVGGDGVGDVAVGAYSNYGDVFVVELTRGGGMGRVVRVYGATLPGGSTRSSGQQFGYAVARWGDVDGDGVAEVLVGAQDLRAPTATLRDGAMYVVWLM